MDPLETGGRDGTGQRRQNWGKSLADPASFCHEFVVAGLPVIRYIG
jgi:hypothetical protein